MKKAVITIILPILLALACLGWTQTRPGCASTIAALEDRVEAQRRLLTDWAGLIRYGSENTELPKPRPNEDRVVFLGDEITERWGQGNAKFFPGKPYLNRGVKPRRLSAMAWRPIS